MTAVSLEFDAPPYQPIEYDEEEVDTEEEVYEDQVFYDYEDQVDYDDIES